jgi:SagB-type dehydrogenase family enzyme
MQFREFHRRSGPSAIREARALLSAPASPTKVYPRYPHIQLPAPHLPEEGFAQIAARRHSTRQYSSTDITLAQLSSLLFAGGGIQGTAPERNDGTPSRHHPSGGALYPLESYVAVFHVENLAAGIYHYAPGIHALERLPADTEIVWQSIKDFAPVEKPAVIIILTALWDRTFPKYGEFAYRLALMEAGHQMQDMLLCAEGEHLSACPIAGFDAPHIARALDIDKDAEDPLYVLLLGV